MTDTPLARKLKARIAREGRISFHDFMQAALFDPEHGYYARGPEIGPGGDFSTSVRFEAYRRAIANLAFAAHDALGRPAAFRFVELGAGTGQLARAVTEAWRAARPDATLDYVTVDASAGLRARQAAVPGVRAVASPRELGPGVGLVFGNEVLDALPVRRVVGGPAGSLLEIVVTVDDAGRFKERLAPLDDAAVAPRLESEGVRVQRGQVCDVAPALEAFTREAAALVERGFLVFVDYGDPAPELYAPTRLNGTLAVYKSHGKFHDPYEEVGERDVTADVDFTCVARAATDAGLEELGLVSQQEFLDALGVHDLGLPDEAAIVAGAAHLGTAFQVAAFRRGVDAALPGF